MGFDVIYLPPIHPIGREFRKGKQYTEASQDDGSPWAIGAQEGGHCSLHPQLGTFEDFEAFVAECHAPVMELAMDIAFVCALDHHGSKNIPNGLIGDQMERFNMPKILQKVSRYPTAQLRVCRLGKFMGNLKICF